MDDELSIAEAAQIIGLSISRVRAIAKTGELRAHRVGNVWIVKRRDVVRFVAPWSKRGRKPGVRLADRNATTNAFSGASPPREVWPIAPRVKL
jgi:excisionase family DNA binding protein